MSEKITYICDGCGEEYEDTEELFDGHEFCTECGFECCVCGGIASQDEIYSTDHGDVCDDCVTVCVACGASMHPHHTSAVAPDGESYCASCMKDRFVCQYCEDVVRLDDEYYCEHCDDYMCRECYEEEHAGHGDGLEDLGYIYEPEYFPAKLNFRNKDGICRHTNELFLGVEWEVDGLDEASDFCDQMHAWSQNNALFYMKFDGSLSEDGGVEICTHPMTIDAHRQQFDWEKYCKLAKKYTNETRVKRTCGLHIHSNSKFFDSCQTEADTPLMGGDLFLYKLAYFYDKHWSPLKALSRRTYTNYCARPAITPTTIRRVLPTEVERLISDETIMQRHKLCGKYMAIQYTGNTYETRLWLGTLDFTQMMATIELTNNIMKHVNNTPHSKIKSQVWPVVVDELLQYDSPVYLKEYMGTMGVI